MRSNELILAATFLLGLIAAEIPMNVKDYTQTSAKYSLESYGGGLAAQVAPAHDSSNTDAPA